MYEYYATVVSVHDGDTIGIDLDLGFYIHMLGKKGKAPSLRFRGIDAPELGTFSAPNQAGQDSTLHLASLLGVDLTGLKRTRPVFGKFGDYMLPTERQVTLPIRTVWSDQTEKYGRVLADVWVGSDIGTDQETINAKMIADGFAVPKYDD